MERHRGDGGDAATQGEAKGVDAGDRQTQGVSDTEQILSNCNHCLFQNQPLFLSNSTPVAVFMCVLKLGSWQAIDIHLSQTSP